MFPEQQSPLHPRQNTSGSFTVGLRLAYRTSQRLLLFKRSHLPCNQWSPSIGMHALRSTYLGISCIEGFVKHSVRPQELVFCTLSVGHGLLSNRVTYIYLLFKSRNQHHDLASCMTGCKNKKSRGILQVAGAPVVFTMSCSHRSLTFLLWHILVTRCTPERLKPLTRTLV